jgi:hypothetical protein
MISAAPLLIFIRVVFKSTPFGDDIKWRGEHTMFPTSYSIANAATVNQTWNRVSTSPGYAKYVNDTARAAGIEETMEFRSTERFPKKSSPTVTTDLGKWNVKLSTRVIATELEPVISNYSIQLPVALSNVTATARSRAKDHRLVIVAVSDTDAEIDDITAFRTQ